MPRAVWLFLTGGPIPEFSHVQTQAAVRADVGHRVASAPPWREPNDMFYLAAERTEIHNKLIDRSLSAHPEVGRFPLAEQHAELPFAAFRDGLHLEQAVAVVEADAWQVPLILDAAR